MESCDAGPRFSVVEGNRAARKKEIEAIFVQKVELSRAGLGRSPAQVGRNMTRNFRTQKIVHLGGRRLSSIDLAEKVL
jgi:hypothetical protein